MQNIVVELVNLKIPPPEIKPVSATDAPRLPQTGADGQELRVVFTGLLLAFMLAALDQNIVATALPRIVSDLGGLPHLSWVVTAFMVASTMTTPLYGKLSDIFGRKPGCDRRARRWVAALTDLTAAFNLASQLPP